MINNGIDIGIELNKVIFEIEIIVRIIIKTKIFSEIEVDLN